MIRTARTARPQALLRYREVGRQDRDVTIVPPRACPRPWKVNLTDQWPRPVGGLLPCRVYRRENKPVCRDPHAPPMGGRTFLYRRPRVHTTKMVFRHAPFACQMAETPPHSRTTLISGRPSSPAMSDELMPDISSPRLSITVHSFHPFHLLGGRGTVQESFAVARQISRSCGRVSLTCPFESVVPCAFAMLPHPIK